MFLFRPFSIAPKHVGIHVDAIGLSRLLRYLPGAGIWYRNKVHVVSFQLALVGVQWNMDVSLNGGTPKSSILIGFSIINHPFWGTTIFGNTQMCRRDIVLVAGFKGPNRGHTNRLPVV